MSVPSSVSFQTLSGDFGPVLGEVARLRLSLFREFPYLYDGTDPATGPARVAQLYCGCPVPGSTPEQWHFVVSQWNTHDSAAGPAGWPYRSMQFVGSIPRPPRG